LIVGSLILGTLGLWIGGDLFVRGSVGLASRLGISELVIGMTLVGFGTSLPELVTSLTAAAAGYPGLMVGNVVGSNIANVLLIVGVAAAITPVICSPESFKRDSIALVAATALGAGMILSGYIGRRGGATLAALLIAYIIVVIVLERRAVWSARPVLVAEANIAKPEPTALLPACLLTAVGLCAVLGGAWLFVIGASELAEYWGISRTFVGLVIVAVGTSLPELTITIVASLKRKSDVVLGNVMGSNMFNILAIPGITALVLPIDVPPELRVGDILVMAVSTVMLVVVAATKLQISRLHGGIFLASYVVYVGARYSVAV
jgi:cation:H+ antiporter